MLNVVLCEDNAEERAGYRDLIAEIIERQSKQSFSTINFALATSNPQEVIKYALESFQKGKVKDNTIYVLDINLNSKLSGLDVAAQIRMYDSISYIIFLTATEEYWHAGYDYGAEHYLIKGNDDTCYKLNEIIERILLKEQRRLDSPHDRIQFKSWRGFVSIPVDCMRCFRRNSEQIVRLYYDFSNNVVLNHTLKEIKQKLQPYPNFIAAHRDTLINIKYTRKIDRITYEVTLDNGLVCPISRRAMRKLKKMWV